MFSNTKTFNKYYGSIEENGVGKFNDVNIKVSREGVQIKNQSTDETKVLVYGKEQLVKANDELLV